MQNLSKESKVQVVVLTYCTVLRDLFQKVRNPNNLPDKGSKTYANCIKFYDLALLVKETLYDLLALGLLMDSVDYCQRTFHTDYLPFNLLVCDSTRNRIAREIPKYVKSKFPDAIWQRVCAVLVQFDKATQVAMVESGVVVGTDKELQQKLLDQLNSKHPLTFSLKEKKK